MRSFNRKTLSRAGVLFVVLMLLFSFTASYAASFTSSGAGIKYSGKTYKLYASISESSLKKNLGQWSSRTYNGDCSQGVVYSYNYKSKGIIFDILLKKKTDTRGRIVAITVTSRKVPTIAGMKIGDSTSSLKNKYGKKYGKSGSKRRYYTGKYNLIVYTKSNKVTKYKLLYDI